MPHVIVDPPVSGQRADFVAAVAAAEALPPDDPDRAEIVAQARAHLERFDRPRGLIDPAERARIGAELRAELAGRLAEEANGPSEPVSEPAAPRR